MNIAGTVSRRRFLQIGAGTAGALLLGFHLPPGGRLARAAAQAPYINAWLRIAQDNSVTILVSNSEMGQGVYTAMPMLVAEELEVDWTRVQAEMAPAGPDYNNRFFGFQGTGGSTSIRQGFDHLRQAGAAAREVLRQAAANRWNIALEKCVAAEGHISDSESGRRLSYGDLAPEAAQLQPPTDITLKPPGQWKIIGQPIRRLDSEAKTRGQAGFGIDVELPDLKVATLAICPVFGGTLKSVDPEPAMTLPGVIAVVPMDDAVAVVADGYWNARKGLQALAPVWDEGAMATADDASIRDRHISALDGAPPTAEAQGDAPAVLAAAGKRIEAEYTAPFLAHATMEPMNATAWVHSDSAEIWAPTQAQGPAQAGVAQMLGFEPGQVAVHTTFLGGGFGRRFEFDFIRYAVLAAQASGHPVKLIWPREEDVRHDFYRPASLVRFSASLDESGLPQAVHARIASASIMQRVFPSMVENGVDPTSVEGLIEHPYAIPNYRVEYAMVDSGIPVGFWRAVGNSQNAYFRESFLDELARAAGMDPLDYRLRLLDGKPRHTAVLKKAADMAGWGAETAAGRYRGLALHESFRSIVAEVVEISLAGRTVRVHEVWCAVDCGTVVNPDTVEAQMESGIVYGLTAALMGEINIEQGRVKQSNFPDYPMLTLATAPRMHTHIMDSAEPPGGVGAHTPRSPVRMLLIATGEPRSLPIRL